MSRIHLLISVWFGSSLAENLSMILWSSSLNFILSHLCDSDIGLGKKVKKKPQKYFWPAWYLTPHLHFISLVLLPLRLEWIYCLHINLMFETFILLLCQIPTLSLNSLPSTSISHFFQCYSYYIDLSWADIFQHSSYLLL